MISVSAMSIVTFALGVSCDMSTGSVVSFQTPPSGCGMTLVIAVKVTGLSAAVDRMIKTILSMSLSLAPTPELAVSIKAGT